MVAMSARVKRQPQRTPQEPLSGRCTRRKHARTHRGDSDSAQRRTSEERPTDSSPKPVRNFLAITADTEKPLAKQRLRFSLFLKGQRQQETSKTPREKVRRGLFEATRSHKTPHKHTDSGKRGDARHMPGRFGALGPARRAPSGCPCCSTRGKCGAPHGARRSRCSTRHRSSRDEPMRHPGFAGLALRGDWFLTRLYGCLGCHRKGLLLPSSAPPPPPPRPLSLLESGR